MATLEDIKEPPDDYFLAHDKDDPYSDPEWDNDEEVPLDEEEYRNEDY